MKKRLLFFIALLFAVAGMWAEATAQCTPGGPITTASTITVCEGTTTVDVPVTVTSFTGVGVISLKLLYDHAKLGTAALLSQNASLWADFTVVIHTGAAYDTIAVSGYGSGITLGDNSTLFILRFSKGSSITDGTLTFYENIQKTSCEYAPDSPPDYTPFCDTPKDTYYIAGGVVVVNFIPGSITGDQTICEGETPVAFSSVTPTGDGAFTYLWKQSIDNGTSWANAPGTNNAETYAPGSLAVDTWYKRVVTSTLNSKACDKETNVVKVFVNNFDPGSISAEQTICEGETPVSFTSVSPTGDGAFTYLWKQSIDNGTSWVNAPGTNNAETYAPGSLSGDTWYKRVVTSILNLKACDKETNVVKVFVNNFDPGSISSDQTICEGETPAAFTSVTPIGDGAFTYLWKQSIDNGISWANAPGTNNSETYAPGSLTADTWYKRVVTSTFNSRACAKETNVVKIFVNNFNPGSVSSDQTICEGDVPASFTSVTPSGDGAFTYLWKQSIDNGSSWANAPGTNNSETYAPGSLTADTWYKRVVTSTLNSKACDKETNVVKVFVNNFDPGSISSNQTICEGETPVAFTSVTPTGDGSFTYLWKQSIDNGISWINAPGTNNAETYAPGVLSADTWYKRVVTSTLNSKACAEETNVVKVFVNNFDPGSISSNQIICEGETPVAFTSVTPTGDGAFTYLWKQSTDEGASWVNASGTNNAETYAPGSLTADTWYKRVVTSTLNSRACDKETNEVKVFVNNFDPGSISSNQTICDGGTPAGLTSVTPTGDGVFTYLWKQSTNNGASWADAPGTNNAESYAPGSLSADTWYKRIVTSTLNFKACTEETNIVVITVNNVTAGAIQSAQTICSGIVPALLTTSTASTGDGTLSYQWEMSTTGPATGFSPVTAFTPDPTYQPPALFVDSWYRRVVKSTIPADPVTCTATSGSIKITINERKTISGVFTYYNNANTILNAQDITVKLYRTSDNFLMGTTTTSNSGYYAFSNLCPDCDYYIVTTSTHTTEGSVNTTDAAQMNNWPAALYSIEKVRFYAGDVTGSTFSINSTDAQRIQAHFVSGTAFDRLPWTFWRTGQTTTTNYETVSYPSVNLPVGSDVTANMYGLCTGDFNRSFDPSLTKSASSTLDLIYSGNRQVSNNQEFDLPLRMVNASTVSAISLILNLPVNMVEVQDVIMNNSGGMLDWAVKGNELRIGWNSPVPLNLSAEAELVTLRLKTTTAFTLGNSIRFTLAANPLNELADDRYEVIGDAMLSVDVIEAAAVGIDEQPAVYRLALSCYPNPFSNITTISYTLPFEGKVTLEIYNILGNKVTTLVSETKAIGNHTVKFDTYGLPSGIYAAKLRLKSADNEMIRTIKLINNR